jgi:hypothetical protein
MAALLKRDSGRVRQVSSGRVPLIYYRRGGGRSSKTSPFQKKPAVPASRFRKALVRLVDLAVIAAVFFCLIYSLIVRPNAQVLLSDSSYHAESVYSSAANKLLKEFINRNKVTLDGQSIVKSLQAQFPEIASAAVELPLFSEVPRLHLDISSPSIFLHSGSSTYIVGASGKAVAKASGLPSIKNLPDVIDQTGFETTVGKQVLSAQAVNFINDIVTQCKHANVPIQSMTLPALAQELDLRTADKGYFVKFFLGSDSTQQIGQFLAARHQFAAGGDQPTEYLDVRVPGKIFFK